MLVLKLEIELRHHYVQSLKEKRRIIKSLKMRLIQKFNASIREDYSESFKFTCIIIAVLVRNEQEGNNIVENIQQFVEENYQVEINNLQKEYY